MGGEEISIIEQNIYRYKNASKETIHKIWSSTEITERK